MFAPAEQILLKIEKQGLRACLNLYQKNLQCFFYAYKFCLFNMTSKNHRFFSIFYLIKEACKNLSN